MSKMPANLPSSFASAAAGQNANRGGRGGSGGDWNRRDGRSANGTLTLRRSSTTPLSQASQTPTLPPDHSVQPPSVEPQLAQPPAQELGPARYTKEELLAMAPPARSAGDVSRLLVPGWNPGQMNGGPTRAWGKSNENHVPQEPGACWDETGESAPLGLQPMAAEEREAFSADINSPLKPPSMLKDGANAAAVNGRKASLSQGAGNAFNASSPSSAVRSGTRRRETSDSNSLGLNSPTATGRGGREDSSSWFARKTGDVKEAADAEEADGGEQAARDASGKLPFGNIVRGNTAGGSGVGSIWSQSNPGTPNAGAFGNFALGGPAAGEKRAAPSAGGGSRLAHLIPKDVSDNAPARQGGEGQNPLHQASWRARSRADTDPFGEDAPSGSAALGGAQETGTAPSQPSRAGTLGTPVKASTGDFGMSGLDLGDAADPASPSETNPFRSPPADRPDQDESEAGAARMYSGFPSDPQSGINPLHRAFPGAPEAHDRSQTSSAGNKGFPLGHVSAWAAPGGPTSSTPDRERSGLGGGAFSPALFGSMGEGPAPGMGNLGGLFGAAGGAAGMGTGSISRGSKLGSLFPAAMQAQMQQAQEQGEVLGDLGADPRHANPLGAIGRGNFGMPMRDTESPMRSSRGVFEELFPSSDATRGQAQGLFGAADASQAGAPATGPQSFTPVSGGMGFGGAVEPPTAQARTMVMPDRMRWVYLDPQGQIQGPFTGLEMNDWYKAHFFTPDLRVKKVEDAEFEPLGQLIRRIGNSREPFLVPQVGIPHGPPSQTGGFPTPNAGGVVPPLSGVFPSFGRTLTAEEQNNLERRKQEEQYMMAQQRDYAMRQSAMSRFQGQQPGLQHHSSAQSLQSQPSFGSMASPMGQMPQQQPMGGMPVSGGPSGGLFDPSMEGRTGPMGPQAGSGNEIPFGDDFLARLSPNERQVLAAIQAGQGANQTLDTMDAADLRANLPGMEELGDDAEMFRQRLVEFQNLRAQRDAEEAAKPAHPPADPATAPTAPTAEQAQSSPMQDAASRQSEAPAPIKARGGKTTVDDDGLSLTEQVQKTQAAALAAQSGEPGMPMPFPPPSSNTPLPAPTAQRARSNLPEQYSRSRTGSPADDQGPPQPPPLAPWAKETASDAHKGPSLKEIQEAEARKAAQAEEAQAAIRKAALEHEASLLREKERQATSAAAGLPATSTWGQASPVTGASPWANPSAAKAPATGSVTGTSAASRKTLAEIQREEESRKQKEGGSSQPRPQPSTSKSYANLAGKPGQLSPASASPGTAAAAPAPSAGWATVGAGGKVKVPTGPSAQLRSTSAAGAKPATGPAVAPSKIMSRPNAAAPTNGSTANAAMDEFRKWVQHELGRGGLSVNDVAGFASTLEALPLEKSIIADAIYASSNIMDGRHFADEYVRRKTLADRGITEKQPVAAAEAKTSTATGGWSEVAKKSSTPTNAGKDETVQGAGFKVVPSRKKGKK